ncbi:hypothetical protein [Raoultella ornithinolytica]|uniref:hypothetical protein n=1 Tax=Raoultella ornithinolytica TaxID=54291 RepID=UPI00301D59EE
MITKKSVDVSQQTGLMIEQCKKIAAQSRQVAQRNTERLKKQLEAMKNHNP